MCYTGIFSWPTLLFYSAFAVLSKVFVFRYHRVVRPYYWRTELNCKTKFHDIINSAICTTYVTHKGSTFKHFFLSVCEYTYPKFLPLFTYRTLYKRQFFFSGFLAVILAIFCPTSCRRTLYNPDEMSLK